MTEEGVSSTPEHVAQSSNPENRREPISKISFDDLKVGDIIYATTRQEGDKYAPELNSEEEEIIITVLGKRKLQRYQGVGGVYPGFVTYRGGLRVHVQRKHGNYYAMVPGVNSSKKSFYDNVDPGIIKISDNDERCTFEFTSLRYEPNGPVIGPRQSSYPIRSLEIVRAPRK